MRRSVLLALALLLALAPAAPAAPAAKRVRLFALQPRFSMAWADTDAHFRDKLVGMVDADVAPHLSGRDLVTLPEDLGLMAAFTGDRAAAARQAPDLVTAIVTLIGAYAPQNAYYAAKYPQLTDRGVPTRLLALSLTDAFVRNAVDVPAEIARRTKAYVVSGALLPASWERVTDPARQALLGDYEATSDRVFNYGLVFDPTGRLIAKVPKAYLVPTELPGALDLVPGEPRVVRTALGRLGILTSKDAWMPDVIDRLDHAGAQILVQPEFFVGDTLATKGMWAADNIAASGYADLLRMPSAQALALPSLTGNVLDFSADNQAAVAVKPPAKATKRLAGGRPMPGLLAVSPTAVPDPLTEGILQRRLALGKAGEAQLPGSGVPCTTRPGACEGGQVESVVRHDVRVGTPARRPVRLRRRGTGRFGANRPLTGAHGPAQRDVRLSAHGGRVRAAFEQAGHVFTVRSADAGRTWSAPRDLGRGGWPSVGGDWVAFARDGKVVVTRGRARTVMGAGTRPSVAAVGDTAFVAWIDPDHNAVGARVGGKPLPLDTLGPASDLAAQLDHDWAPSVAAHGSRVEVAWTDFRGYDWDVYAATSRDGGRTFAAPRQLSRTPDDLESLTDAPSVAFAGARPRVAWTNYAKVRTPSPAPLYDVAVDGVQVDGHGADQVNSFAPSLAPPFVAWQDHPGDGAGVIRVRRLGDHPIRRVQDAGARGNAFKPAIVRAGKHLVVAWEDERGGVPRIYVARALLRAV